MQPYTPTDDKLDNDYTSFYLGYPDDDKMIADMLSDNWSLDGPADADRRPPIYYDVSKASTRSNSQGGSIFVYTSSFQPYNVAGIDYDSSRRSKTMSIDIQNPQSRQRHQIWVREAVRILNAERRAGRMRLGGWDSLEITSARPINNYLNYYQSTIDIKLTRNLIGYDNSGK